MPSMHAPVGEFVPSSDEGTASYPAPTDTTRKPLVKDMVLEVVIKGFMFLSCE